MKKLEPYQDEKERNRRKVARRREALDLIAQAAGWRNWAEYETAVKQGGIAIARPVVTL